MIVAAVPKGNQISKTLEGDLDMRFVHYLNFKKQLLPS